MLSLRQKTYGIFIRPYVEFGGDRLVQRDTALVKNPCPGTSGSPTSALTLQGGSIWMLYNNEYLTSYTLVRQRVKEIMDNLGYSKNDIHVCEVIPIDTIVTPLV